MNYALKFPFTFNGERIESVRVSVPDPRAFRGRSPFVPREIWSLSRIAAIPVRAAEKVDMEDAAAISRLFTAMAEEAKSAANAITAAGARK